MDDGAHVEGPSSSEPGTRAPSRQLETTVRKDEYDTEARETRAQQPLWDFILQEIDKHFPKVYARISSALQYISGPSPPRALFIPRPLFDLDFRLPTFLQTDRREKVKVSMETWFHQRTRIFMRTWLMLLFGAVYIICLAFIARAQWFTIPAESFVTCTSTYWSRNDGCGLDGESCAPFVNTTFDFRCPAQCLSVILRNPRTIGSKEVDFVPLVVGGGNSGNASFLGSYRGDSFVCAAAIHAGVINNAKGGCASLALVGTQGPFESSTAHGLTSAAFPTFFPLAFRFSSGSSLKGCSDLRNVALAFNIIASCIVFLFLRPRPLVLYWCLVCMGYWHVIFFSQPAGAPPSISNAFGTFLPVLFICHVFWEIAWRYVLPQFSSMPLERAVWYLGAFWPGVLYNILTDRIPIDRLLASDIAHRPGSIVALIIAVLVLAVLIFNQLRVIRQAGWIPYYVAWYIVGGLIAMVLALLPGLEFRLHHYIAAGLLMPLTAFPTRFSAIYQAFLLGMFLNGAAAFGLAAIVQTPRELQRDGPQGSTLPTFLTNSSTYNSTTPLGNQTLQWEAIPASNPDGWNGFALLVDDVERYLGNALNFSLATLDASVPHFFRLAFQQNGQSGDFTKAATIWPNGTWLDPPPGRS